MTNQTVMKSKYRFISELVIQLWISYTFFKNGSNQLWQNLLQRLFLSFGRACFNHRLGKSQAPLSFTLIFSLVLSRIFHINSYLRSQQVLRLSLSSPCFGIFVLSNSIPVREQFLVKHYIFKSGDHLAGGSKHYSFTIDDTQYTCSMCWCRGSCGECDEIKRISYWCHPNCSWRWYLDNIYCWRHRWI